MVWSTHLLCGLLGTRFAWVIHTLVYVNSPYFCKTPYQKCAVWSDLVICVKHSVHFPTRLYSITDTCPALCARQTGLLVIYNELRVPKCMCLWVAAQSAPPKAFIDFDVPDQLLSRTASPIWSFLQTKCSHFVVRYVIQKSFSLMKCCGLRVS